MNEDTLADRARIEDHESSGLTHDVLFMDDLAYVLRTSRSSALARIDPGSLFRSGPP